MRDQQPANNPPSIASAEWIQALQNFCHRGRVYDGSAANAWLLDACLLVPSAALIHGVIEYVLNSREDIPYGGLRPSWVAQRLEQEGLISHRCGAVLHWQEHGYRFSTVVRIDPEQIWPDKRSRPEAFVTGPLDSQELGVIEILAHPNARRRSPSPVRLAALVRSSLAIPAEPLHPIANPPALHAVLATYPDWHLPNGFQWPGVATHERILNGIHAP